MPVKPALAQNPVHALFGGKRERTRVFRSLRRQFRHVFVDRLQRRDHPGVFARLAPAGEGQPARRPQRFAHVRKRQPPDRQRTSRRTARPADQNLRDRTDRRWRPPARNRPANPSARSPAPAPASALICRRPTHGLMARPSRAKPIVVTPLPQPISMTRSPGLRFRAIDHKVGDRSKQDVLRRLPVGPALPGRSVPIGDLVGVLFVACRGVHVEESFIAGPPPLLRNFGPTVVTTCS